MHASDTSMAATDSCRLVVRVGAPEMWVYSPRNGTHSLISRGTSATSTSGNSPSTRLRSSMRLSGSSTASSGVTTIRSAPSRSSIHKFFAAVFRCALHVTERDLEDVHDIVLCAPGQGVSERYERGGSPLWCEIAKLADPGVLGVAGHPSNSTPRQSRQVDVPGAEGADLSEPVKALDEAGNGRAER